MAGMTAVQLSLRPRDGARGKLLQESHENSRGILPRCQAGCLTYWGNRKSKIAEASCLGVRQDA